LDLTWKAFTPEQFRAKVTKARLGSATGLAAPRCTLRSLAARGIAA
jgi:hypothetical protein